MQQRSGRLEGKVAIVTGGASGIGEATSVLFASEGAKVVILDIQEELGHTVEKNIQSQGGVAKFIKHNITDKEGWKTVVDTVLSTYGRLDILINNAAVAPKISPVAELSLEEFRRVNTVNVEGPFLGIQAAIPALKKNENTVGSIVNISSFVALMGFNAGQVHYAASKGAVRSLTKAVAAELGGTKIRVNSIFPGYVDTPMLRSALETMPDKGEAFLTHFPFKGEPKDIAYACLYLASDESKFVNGIELIVDGGLVNIKS